MGHAFCQGYLRAVMEDVRKVIKDSSIRWQAYGFKTSFGYEFHGPDKFYVFLGHKADCLWSARAYGWQMYLDHINFKPEDD